MADEDGDAPPDDAGTPDGPADEGDGDASPDDEAAAADTGRTEANTRECPECAENLPADARFCPSCSTAIDDDGDPVDLSELDGDILPDDPSTLLAEDENGLRRASGKVRALSGLAVSLPLAPLVLFIVGTVTSLSPVNAALVFLGGWLGSAAVLSRARVPAEAFGHSLYLVAVGTLLVPVAIEVAGDESWASALTVSFETVATVSLVIAAVLVVLGTFVTGQARGRVAGERRAFEDYRED